MFCPNCGSPNPENAVHCGSCGTQLGAPAPQQAVAPQPSPGAYAPAPVGSVPNHMGISIAAMVVNFLGCCLPIFGIIAIVYASQVNGKLSMGDVAGAHTASKNAKTFAMIGLIVGGLFFVVSLVANIASALLVGTQSGGY